MNIVFAYTLLEGPDPRLAVAIFPATRSTVLIAGATTKVKYTEGESWNDFAAELDTIQYLEGPEALQYARVLRAKLIEEGVLAGDPIPQPPAQRAPHPRAIPFTPKER